MQPILAIQQLFNNWSGFQVKGVLTKDGKKASDLQLGGKWDEKFVVSGKGGAETVVWQKDETPRPKCRQLIQP